MTKTDELLATALEQHYASCLMLIQIAMLSESTSEIVKQIVDKSAETLERMIRARKHGT